MDAESPPSTDATGLSQLPDPDSHSRPGNSWRRWRPAVLLILLFSGAAIIIHIWYEGSHVDSRSFLPDELASGPRSQIIRWNEHHTGVQIAYLSRQKSDHLWRVVTDQGRFNEFMPFVESTTVERGADGNIVEKQVLNLPFGRENLELAITLEESSGSRRAVWRQVQGSLAFNQGAWIVEDHAGQAVLRYQVAGSLRWWPQWIVNYAMRRRLPPLLEAVERRVEELATKEPEYFAQGSSPSSGHSGK